MKSKLIFIDTDNSLGTPMAEIDDGAALIMLCRNKQVKILGISTVTGNVSANLSLQNSCRILTFLKIKSIPIGQGAVLPLIEDPRWFLPWQKGYGYTKPWNCRKVHPAGINLLVDKVRFAQEKVTILAIGPLTNLALAVRVAPDMIDNISEIITMGGSNNEKETVAEFNIRFDPEAAHIVLNAGWPVKLIGLNLTKQIVFTRSDFRTLAGKNPAVKLFKSQAFGWINRVEKMGWEKDGCALHDAVAAAAVLNPDLFEFSPMKLKVELSSGDKRGIIRFERLKDDIGKSSIQVATRFNISECRDLIWTLLNDNDF